MRRLSGFLVGVLAITLLLTACGGSKSADTPTKLTVGYIPVMIDAPLYVGIEKGYFRRENIDINLAPLAGGTDVITQTATGNFDVGLGGLGVGTFNALSKNIGITVVAPLHSETPPVTTPLVVSKKAYDSGQIRSVADLKAKKVAIDAAGSATEIGWRAHWKRVASLTDVQVETVAFSDVPAALANGAIAASMLGEPIVTQAKDMGQIQVLSDDFISGFFPTIVLYNTKFAQNKKSAAQGFMNAYIKACRDLQGNAFKTDAIASIVEKYTKVPADVAKRSNAPTFDPNGQFKIDDLQTMQQFYFERGGLTYKYPLICASRSTPRSPMPQSRSWGRTSRERTADSRQQAADSERSLVPRSSILSPRHGRYQQFASCLHWRISISRCNRGSLFASSGQVAAGRPRSYASSPGWHARRAARCTSRDASRRSFRANRSSHG